MPIIPIEKAIHPIEIATIPIEFSIIPIGIAINPIEKVLLNIFPQQYIALQNLTLVVGMHSHIHIYTLVDKLSI